MAAVIGSVQIFLDVQTGGLSKFNRAASSVARDGDRMNKSLARVGNGFSDSMRQAGLAAVAFNGHLGGMAARLRAASQIFGGFGTSAAIAGAGIASVTVGMDQFIRRADMMKRMDNNLRTVTSSMGNLRDVQQDLFDVSQRARAPMEGTVTLYARTARALEHLGTSQADVLRITETVQKAFAVGGASTQEAMGAAIQLSQGIASDRFSGEEFRSVAENAPVLLRAMADQLGVNIGKLREMAHAGELTGEVVAKAILGASAAIDADFGKTVSTVEQSLARINNGFNQYVYEVDKTYGVTDKLAGAINALAENFDTLGSVAGYAMLAATAVGAGKLGGAAFGHATRDAEGNKVAAGGLRGAVRTVFTDGLFAGVRKQAAEEVKASKAAIADLEKEFKDVAKQITAAGEKSNEKLTQMGMAHHTALAAARAKEADAHKAINDIASKRVSITNDLSRAQASVVQQLKLEQQEALKSVRSHAALMKNAGNRFHRYGKGADRVVMEDEQRKLTAAQEEYRKATEKLAIAQKGAFDDAAIKKYGKEIQAVQKQLISNHKELFQAQQRFAIANAEYVAAQRKGVDFARAAADERYRALRVIADLENRQHDLNASLVSYNSAIAESTKRITLLGAAQMRLRAFGSGIFGALGGGPGVAIMATVGALVYLSNASAKAAAKTQELTDEMRELGFLAAEAGDQTEKLANVDVERLKLKLSEINFEFEKFINGQGAFERLFNFNPVNLGNIAKEVKDIGDNIFNWKATRGAAREVGEIVSLIQQGKIAADEANASLDIIARQDVGDDLLQQISNVREAIDLYVAFGKMRAKARKDAADVDDSALVGEFERAQAAIDKVRQSIQLVFSINNRRGIISSADLVTLQSLEERMASGSITAEQFVAELDKISGEQTGGRAAAFKGITEQVKGFVEELKDAVDEMRRLNEETQKSSYVKGRMSDAAGQRLVDYWGAQGALRDQKSKAELSDFDAEVEKKKEEIIKTLGSFGDALKDIDIEAEAISMVTTERNAKSRNATIGGYVDEVVETESGGNRWAKNSKSTATGLGQFIESTWLNMFRKYYPAEAANMSKDEILALRTDSATSRRMIELYAQENHKILSAAGLSVDKAALHLAHFLGPQGAVKVLSADPGTPIASLLDAAAIKANPTILGGGATAGSVVGYAQRRAGMDTDYTQQIERTETFAKKLKELGLEAAASRLDEFNRKVVEFAAANESIPVEKIQQYIDAIITGDLSKVPEEFDQIVAGLERMRDSELWAKIDELRAQSGSTLLSDIDKELVSLLESMGYAGPELEKIIRLLSSGSPEQLSESIRNLREQIILTSEDKRIEEFADGMAEAFGDFFMSVATGAESFSDALKNLGRRLLDLAMEILVIQPLVESLKTLFKGGLSGGGESKSGGGGLIGNVLSFIPKLFGFSSGTANTGGQRGQARGIVHGQEAVIPLPNGGKVPVEMRVPSITPWSPPAVEMRMPMYEPQNPKVEVQIVSRFDADGGFETAVEKTATKVVDSRAPEIAQNVANRNTQTYSENQRKGGASADDAFYNAHKRQS